MDIIYKGKDASINSNLLLLSGKNSTETTVTSSLGKTWISRGTRTNLETIISGGRALTILDSGKTFSNSLATATSSLTLPDNAGTGAAYNFVRTTNFPLRIIPQNATILYSAGLMTAGKYLQLSSIGARISLVFDGTNWIATNEIGTLTEETP